MFGRMIPFLSNLNKSSQNLIAENGINYIHVLGWFFSSEKFRFFNKIVLTEIFISIKRYCCCELNIEKIFHLLLFFVKLWGFEYCV